MKKGIFISCIIMLFPVMAWGNYVRAFVDRTQATIDDTIYLTAISNGKGEVDISPIRDFQVLYRGTTNSVEIVNGQPSQQTAYHYALTPLRQGHLLIPSLVITVGAGKNKTSEIIVNISNTPQEKDIDHDVYAVAEISEGKPYVGQPIIYTIKLFSAVKIANATLSSEPAFKGFIAKKINDIKSSNTSVNGRVYNIDRAAYILIPATAGLKVIEPAVLTCDILQGRQGSGKDLFAAFWGGSLPGREQGKPRTFRTTQQNVAVRNLPSDPLGGRFSGLVGNFTLEGILERAEINAGDSTTLSITLKGNGNIIDASAPEINLPTSIKVYQENPQENIQVGPDGYSGGKEFRFALVPITEGRYSIGPVSLRYFDPVSHAYRTAATPSFALTAKPFPTGSKTESTRGQVLMPQPKQPGQKEVSFANRDIMPLKDDFRTLGDIAPISLPLFVLYLLVPLLLFLGARVGGILRKRGNAPASMMAQKARQALGQADNERFDEAFLASLYRALIYSVFSKAGLRGESLSHTEAEKLLTAHGLSSETAAEAASLLQKIAAARYSGMNLDILKRNKLLTATRQMVKRLS